MFTIQEKRDINQQRNTQFAQSKDTYLSKWETSDNATLLIRNRVLIDYNSLIVTWVPALISQHVTLFIYKLTFLVPLLNIEGTCIVSTLKPLLDLCLLNQLCICQDNLSCLLFAVIHLFNFIAFLIRFGGIFFFFLRLSLSSIFINCCVAGIVFIFCL